MMKSESTVEQHGSGAPVAFTLDGLTYAGIEWRREKPSTIIAIHGWLDNALSFAELGPRLAPYRVIALDLSGHGLSDWRSPDATYNIWDDVPQLAALTRSLGDQSVVILGHSRGAAIATILAGILGPACSHLVLIDGLINAFNDENNTADQLTRFVNDRQKYMTRAPRIFQSVEEFVERRRAFGFDDDSAYKLAPRALEAVETGFRLRTDPRLHGASALWLSAQQRDEIYASVTAPVLAIRAQDGLFSRSGVPGKMLGEASCHFKKFEQLELNGGHHLHMSETTAPALAEAITTFIAS